MKKAHIWVAIWAILILAPILIVMAAYKPAQGQKVDIVKVGVILPLTGPLSNLGEDIKNGLELMPKRPILAPGTPGAEALAPSLVFIYEDSASDPKTALQAANKLIAGGVSAVIAGPGSSANMAIAPLFQEAKIPFISISATPKLTDAGDFIFRMLPGIEEEVNKSADLFLQKGYKKVAFIYDSSADSNVIGLEAFTKRFTANANSSDNATAANGNEILSDGYDTKTTTDFRTQLLKAKASNPDAYYFLGTDKASSIFARNMKDLGIRTPVYGWSPTDTDQFLKTAGSNANGFTLTTFRFSCAKENTSDTENSVGAGEVLALSVFCKEYPAQYANRQPSFYAAHAFDLGNILFRALNIQRDEKGTREAIQNALTGHQYKGITGTLFFDSKGNVTNRDLVFRTAKNGVFVSAE